MDLFWIDHSNQRIFIAQCKYSRNGKSKPKVKDVTALFSVSNWLSSPEGLEREGRPELAEAAKSYQEVRNQGYTTQLWFVYCGPKDENIDKEIRMYNQNPENERYGRTAVNCDIGLIETLFNELRGEGRRIEFAKINIGKSFEVQGSFGKGIVTSIAASDLVSLYRDFGDYLFARNVRGWLGARKGSVNASIIETVENERESGNFWAYNNGITIVCDEYTPPEDLDGGVLQLSKFSIVNGCQTTVALARSDVSTITNKIFVLARIICPPNSIIDSVQYLRQN
jgi:hypothetical protein